MSGSFKPSGAFITGMRGFMLLDALVKCFGIAYVIGMGATRLDTHRQNHQEDNSECPAQRLSQRPKADGQKSNDHDNQQVHYRLRQSTRCVAATYTQDCCVTGWPPEGCGMGAVTAIAPGLVGAGLYMVCGGWYWGTRNTGGGGNVWDIAAVAHRIDGIISSFRTVLSVAMRRQSASKQYCMRNCMGAIL